MSGQWPPEWDDSDTGLPDGWDADGAARDQEASAVTLFLASVPSPVLPASFEARISAAIAAEAAARAEDVEAADRSSSPQGSSSSAAEGGPVAAAKHRRRRRTAASRGATRGSGPASSRPDGRRRRLRLPSPAVTAPLLILLFIAGFGLVITQFGSSSSSSSSVQASGGVSASVPSPFAGNAGPAKRYPETQPKSPVLRGGGTARSAGFTVASSGISYQESTLATQVQTELNGQNAALPAASAPGTGTANGEPSASAAASVAAPASVTPSVRLRGCVARVTGGATPSLVDRASYDGTPAYIIAVPGRAWVVGPACSAANPQEITSVSLPGLSGNLSALGSVEGYASPGERRMQ